VDKILFGIAVAGIVIFLTLILVVQSSPIAFFGMDYVKEQVSQKIRNQGSKEIVVDLIHDEKDYSQECFWAKFLPTKEIIQKIIGGRELIETIENDFVNEYGKKPTDAEFKGHALVMCERELAYEKSKAPMG
jgi:hypothetical protein